MRAEAGGREGEATGTASRNGSSPSPAQGAQPRRPLRVSPPETDWTSGLQDCG